MEWSRPRLTPMAGRRKATLQYCDMCYTFHRTHRHPEGAEECPEYIRKPDVDFPTIKTIPRTASK